MKSSQVQCVRKVVKMIEVLLSLDVNQLVIHVFLDKLLSPPYFPLYVLFGLPV